MEGLLRLFGDLSSPHERVLAVVIVAVGLLSLLAFVFAIAVVLIRVGHVRRRTRTASIAERLSGPLLDVLGGSAEPEVVHALVRRGEEIEVLAFLLRYARRLRGRETQVLAIVSAPYMPAALQWLKSRSPEERAHAVQALAAFGMPEHAPVVLAALDDPSAYVAMTAAQALARSEHARYAELVMRRLWRFVDWSGDYLGALLARIGPAAAPPARQILADPKETLHARAVAAEVLLRLNDVRAADVAAAVLQAGDAQAPGESAEMLVSALRLIAQVGREDHVAAVREYAASPDGLVRAEALRALAALGGEREVPALMSALEDDSTWVVHEAARGLLQLGHGAVLDELMRRGTAASVVARQVVAEAERR